MCTSKHGSLMLHEVFKKKKILLHVTKLSARFTFFSVLINTIKCNIYHITCYDKMGTMELVLNFRTKKIVPLFRGHLVERVSFFIEKIVPGTDSVRKGSFVYFFLHVLVQKYKYANEKIIVFSTSSFF